MYLQFEPVAHDENNKRVQFEAEEKIRQAGPNPFIQPKGLIGKHKNSNRNNADEADDAKTKIRQKQRHHIGGVSISQIQMEAQKSEVESEVGSEEGLERRQWEDDDRVRDGDRGGGAETDPVQRNDPSSGEPAAAGTESNSSPLMSQAEEEEEEEEEEEGDAMDDGESLAQKAEEAAAQAAVAEAEALAAAQALALVEEHEAQREEQDARAWRVAINAASNKAVATKQATQMEADAREAALAEISRLATIVANSESKSIEQAAAAEALKAAALAATATVAGLSSSGGGEGGNLRGSGGSGSGSGSGGAFARNHFGDAAGRRRSFVGEDDGGAAEEAEHIAVRHAVAAGDLDSLKSLLLRLGPAHLHKKDANSWQLLHEAIRTGRIESVKFLVSLGADVSSKIRAGGTPLWMAKRLYNDSHPIVKFLVEIGAPDEDEL